VRLSQKTILHKKGVKPMTDLAQVGEAANSLSGLLDQVLAYVEDVLADRVQPDNAVGRALLDMVHSVPTISPERFEEMFNSNIKVLLHRILSIALGDTS
jgi:translation initiation factor 3 subunit F